MKDLEEMKAHNVCLKMTITEAREKDKPLTEYFIRTLHQTMLREDYTVYRQLPGGETTSYVVHAGCYKTRPNSVITPTGERFEYASPEETSALMADLVNWYNSVATEGKLTPVELATMFHYRYIRIHPFEDGNGRIARLMVNFILMRHDYPMIVVRSRKKSEYLEALHQADMEVGPVPADGALRDPLRERAGHPRMGRVELLQRPAVDIDARVYRQYPVCVHFPASAQGCPCRPLRRVRLLHA
jgi:Fic family protein